MMRIDGGDDHDDEDKVDDNDATALVNVSALYICCLSSSEI